MTTDRLERPFWGCASHHLSEDIFPCVLRWVGPWQRR